MNFTRFVEQLELYLTVEQRGRWCAVGLIDINSFKWYNDTFGHAMGDRIIERVARLLQEHVRADDLVAHDSLHELHARFGGDEFCFLIPNLDDVSVAAAIADRYREAVARYNWRSEDERLADRPVTVDIGVACLMLGPLEQRRRMGPQLARDLLAYADRLMYKAKNDQAARAYPLALRVDDMSLVVVDPGEAAV
jgi:diguanylate cyclase (GGDEF)-like protein